MTPTTTPAANIAVLTLGLRELADKLAAVLARGNDEEIAELAHGFGSDPVVTLTVWARTYGPDEGMPHREEPEVREAMATLSRALGGRFDKGGSSGGYYFELTQQLGEGAVVLEIITERTAVCERKVIGTKPVEKREIPHDRREAADELRQQLADLEVVATEEEEIVEWECPPSILAATARDQGRMVEDAEADRMAARDGLNPSR